MKTTIWKTKLNIYIDLQKTIVCSFYLLHRCITDSEKWSSQLIFQFKQLERRSLKKNQGFNGIRTRDLRDTGAMLYQLSYEATH